MGNVDLVTPDVKQCVMQLFLSPQIKGQVLSDSQLMRTRCNNSEYKYRVLNGAKGVCLPLDIPYHTRCQVNQGVS